MKGAYAFSGYYGGFAPGSPQFGRAQDPPKLTTK